MEDLSRVRAGGGSDQIDAAAIEAIAVRVVELLYGRGPEMRLVSAAELSERLGLARSTIYEKAGELGAIRIGSGPRARLRFDPDEVARRLKVEPQTERARKPQRAPARPPRRTRRRSQVDPSVLLPIRGRAPR